MINFYTEQMPLLEAQRKYEETLAAIDQARFNRAMANVQMARLMAGPPKEQEKSAADQPKTERKLKTQ